MNLKNTMNYNGRLPRFKLRFMLRRARAIFYPKIREVIHNGSKPPKLGTYTLPPPYLVVKHN